jgi:hypothetical protein
MTIVLSISIDPRGVSLGCRSLRPTVTDRKPASEDQVDLRNRPVLSSGRRLFPAVFMVDTGVSSNPDLRSPVIMTGARGVFRGWRVRSLPARSRSIRSLESQ